MLQQMCEYLNNYFKESVTQSNYALNGSMVSPAPALKEGQRFWINGSSLNDGVYTYHEAGIMDDDEKEVVTFQPEEFKGSIVAMAVPVSVIKLAGEIGDWVAEYGKVLNSPYQSESVIGVYSYTKSSGGGSGAGGDGGITWQTKFEPELKRWRKICL